MAIRKKTTKATVDRHRHIHMLLATSVPIIFDFSVYFNISANARPSNREHNTQHYCEILRWQRDMSECARVKNECNLSHFLMLRLLLI